MVLLLKCVALLLIIDCTAAQPDSEIWEEVPCGRSESCECMGTTRTPDPICHFTLNISQSHTFTRYFLDPDLRIPGFGGRVMYFAEPETAGQGSRKIIKDYPREKSERNSEMSCDDGRIECTDPITVDGYSFRSVITVNNRFPAPNLIVPYNAVVVVDVNNTLDSESTSIHWHGMHQMNTPWMDGVEHITQCGIPPASSFRYIFRAFPAGTHWYHSHSGAQRTDGLFGALIVKESTNIQTMVQSTFRASHGGSFMDMPQSHTLTLIDWQPKNSIELFTQLHSGIRFYDLFTAPTDPEADSRVPRTCSPDGIEVGPVNFWSGLINGRGKHKLADYNKVRLSVFTIPSRAQRYRFRLIGAQGLFAFRFSIDEHRLLLIATDGHFIVPRMVDFIIIHSGERYDFIPQIRDSATIENDYIIRAETLEVELGCERLGQNQLIPENRAEAILHYGNDDNIPNNGMYNDIEARSMSNGVWCSTNKNCTAVNCPFENFHSDYGINCTAVDELRALPGIISESDPMVYTTDNVRTRFFNFGFEGDTSTSAINGRNFEFPLEPPQLARDPNQQITTACDFSENVNEICRTREPNQLIREECRCTQVHRIEYGQTYRFVFTAVGPRDVGSTEESRFANWNFSHPVHLHGHSFRVTKIGFGSYREETGRIMHGSFWRYKL